MSEMCVIKNSLTFYNGVIISFYGTVYFGMNPQGKEYNDVQVIILIVAETRKRI